MEIDIFLFRGIAVLVLGLASTGLAGDKKQEKCCPDGFTDLFNGKNLSGWTTTGNWLIEPDGVLAIKPREGEKGWQRFSAYLYTEREYSDFILDLEYKHPVGGNSGVFLRVGDPADPVSSGLEVQILDSYKKKGKLGHHDNGGIIKTAGPTKNMSKPAGEWNRLILTARGTHLKVELNGEAIQDIELSQFEGSREKPLKGRIALQDHGLDLWFRNIRLRKL